MSARESQASVSSIETFWHTAESSPSTAHPQRNLCGHGRPVDVGGSRLIPCIPKHAAAQNCAAVSAACVAFVLSRIVGFFGFSERGWVRLPPKRISVGAEALTILLCAACLLSRRGAADR
jgi:hypothetical protein